MGQSRRSVHVFALRLHLLKIAWLSRKQESEAKIMSQLYDSATGLVLRTWSNQILPP